MTEREEIKELRELLFEAQQHLDLMSDEARAVRKKIEWYWVKHPQEKAS